jgi:hypothetical protein
MQGVKMARFQRIPQVAHLSELVDISKRAGFNESAIIKGGLIPPGP